MKQLLLAILAIAFTTGLKAQFIKNIGNRAKQKVEQKANQKVDKTIDKALEAKPASWEEPAAEATPASAEDVKTAASTEAPENLKAYSKYDFVQGEKLVAYEDFSNAVVGDFPTRWNTNGSGEIVTLNNVPGKWLKIDKEGYFHPEFIHSLPENSTLEFDLGVNNNFDWYSQTMQFFITNMEDPNTFADGYWRGRHTINIELHPNRDATYHHGKMWFRSELNGNPLIQNDVAVRQWNNTNKNFAHISLWRQGQRLRIYINGEKLTDLPRAFAADGKYNALVFNANGFHKEGLDFYLLGNFRLATGAPDTRSKLITEGRFVTTGITFDVNSDQLRPDSYGVLKEIAGALSENPSVKIRIIGHTDSDGDEKANLDLSKRRAAAVKAALAADFGIDGARIETAGMGESKPEGDNKTAQGKAQNRRVEFVKH